ncbi:MAG TPA: EAL domain-containing protein, partial [Chloroflexota bacterium]|nr:EAL domain-containing protein [Chloroflexota bacterium]
YVLNRRTAPSKAAFNTASVMVSVATAACAISLFGGPNVLLEGDGWRGLIASLVASGAYYVVSACSVALVVALDQRRPILHVLRGKVGVKTLSELGLGLLGATLAVLLTAAPGFAPALLVPAAMAFLAKRALDRAAYQARNLVLTNTVGRAVAGTLSLDQAFDAITAREVRDMLRLDGLALLPLADSADFEARVAADRDQPALRKGMAERIAQTSARLHLYRRGEIPAGWLDFSDAARCVAVVALPCGVGSAAPIGALVAWRTANGVEAFTPAELLLLETLADYAAVALETTRLFREAVLGRADAEEREARIHAVMDNVADGLLTFDRNGQLESSNPAAERIFGITANAMIGQSITVLLPGTAATPSELTVASRGEIGKVLKREVDGRRADGTIAPLELSITAIPQAETPRFIAVVRDISERKAFEEQLRHMAFHDHLTGLPNRALFMDRVEQALGRADRNERSVAVLFLDLDNFKVVNDSVGHAAGDRLLTAIADRLRACLGPESTLARFGGDEFTVLLEDVRDVDEVNAIAQRIRDALQQPIRIAERDVFATVSIGIAASTPGQDTPGNLVRNADVAMYRAKSDGRARWVIFDRGLDANAVERLELESELRLALERDELVVYFQPIVTLGTGRIQDMEALVRWRHPEHGLIAPDRFIPLAEETGLIIPMGQWVLETACAQLRAWQLRFGDRDMAVSVNLSARQFQHPTLVSDVARVLQQTGLQPECLMLEITESLAMRDAVSTASILAELKSLGVRVAMDDFGTGYSSLSYLQRFPIDVLKIDRSFVSQLGRGRPDEAIVEAVIALARGLSMDVTAEGIETSEQLTRLQKLGCQRGQGYYFARPLTAPAATEMLAQQDQTEEDWLAAAA